MGPGLDGKEFEGWAPVSTERRWKGAPRAVPRGLRVLACPASSYFT